MRETTVVVRPAGAADIPALVELRIANAEAHLALDPDVYRVPRREAVVRHFTGVVAGGSGDAVLVAEAPDGRVVGMVEVLPYPDPPEHQILRPARSAQVHTVVLPEARGLGLGSRCWPRPTPGPPGGGSGTCRPASTTATLARCASTAGTATPTRGCPWAAGSTEGRPPDRASRPALASAPGRLGSALVANHLGSRLVAAAVLLLLSGCTSGEDIYKIEQLTPSPGRPLPSPAEARRSYLQPARTLSPHPPGSICPNGQPPVPGRDRADAAVTARVDRAWQRIERWLRRNAPASYATLNPPAAAKDIAATERFMSVAFPADLVASLRRHDGARTTDLRAAFSLPPFYVPMSLDGIRADWRRRCTIIERAGEQPGWWWHPKYVPFAEDFAGDCLFADQRPAGAGRVGWHRHEEGVFFDRPLSVVELLEATATALESGRPYDSARPQVTDGVLDWEIGR